MTGAHRDVGDAELEEPPTRLPVWHSVDPLKMLVERRLEHPIEEVLHGKRRGVVRPGGLAGARLGVEIHLPRVDLDFAAGTGREVGLGPRVHRQVRLGERELALEEALVDRSECCGKRTRC